MSSGMIAVCDTDLFKYECAAAGETRSVLVEHSSGFIKEYKSRTEFHGRSKLKDGGELAKINKDKETPFLHDEFIYTDIRIAEPLDRVLDSTKNTIDSAVRLSGAVSAKHFVGIGDSFRLDRSTLIRYKGERSTLVKPIHLDAVTDFIIKHYGAEVISGIEVDDKVVMESFRKPDHFVLCVDKDARSQPVKVFDLGNASDGIMDCSEFGELYVCTKGKTPKVRGRGYLHLYYQMLAGDSVDNIKPNCFSDVKLASMGAYNLLKDCKDHKDAWTVIRDTYQRMYPEEKVVIGWRGEEITIDWKYVLNEVFDLVRMVRWDGDVVVATDVMEKILGSQSGDSIG